MGCFNVKSDYCPRYVTSNEAGKKNETVFCKNAEDLAAVIVQYSRNTSRDIEELCNLIKPYGLSIADVSGAVRKARNIVASERTKRTKGGNEYVLY